MEKIIITAFGTFKAGGNPDMPKVIEKKEINKKSSHSSTGRAPRLQGFLL
jgi:hypothetical protein